MNEPKEVRITYDHIKDGKKHHCEGSPTALAVMSLFPEYKYACVDYGFRGNLAYTGDVLIYDNKDRMTCVGVLPRVAIDFANDWDMGIPVSPCSFVVNFIRFNWDGIVPAKPLSPEERVVHLRKHIISTDKRTPSYDKDGKEI